MPIDYHHSFADGLVKQAPGLLQRILWRFSTLFLYKGGAYFKLWRAWKQFNANATLGPGTSLGVNAVCINKTGQKGKIIISDHSVIKGILRVEAFGNGYIKIADNVFAGDDTLISSSNAIEIGSYTMIAHGVQIYDNDSHPIGFIERARDWDIIRGSINAERDNINSAPVIIGSHVWIGFNSIIMKGVSVGNGSIIAAGSVITKDIPENCIVAGNPGKIVRSLTNG